MEMNILIFVWDLQGYGLIPDQPGHSLLFEQPR